MTNFGVINLGRKSWTQYIKQVGLVAGESLERNRRDPANMYDYAQIDKTAFWRRFAILFIIFQKNLPGKLKLV